MERVDSITDNLTTSLTALEQRVRFEAFKAVLGGEAPPVHDLAQRLDAPATDVEEAAGRLLERGLLTMGRDERVNGSHGLTIAPTGHRVTFDFWGSLCLVCARRGGHPGRARTRRPDLLALLPLRHALDTDRQRRRARWSGRRLLADRHGRAPVCRESRRGAVSNHQFLLLPGARRGLGGDRNGRADHRSTLGRRDRSP